MELVFRKLPPAEAIKPQPGEIYLVPAAQEHRHRRDLASFVLESGVNALLRGPGNPNRVVIDADPKLDDMLAAMFVERQLTGQPNPAGCKAFAKYASMLRDGFWPTAFPLQDTLEGVFLAIRCHSEKSLTDSDSARQFVSDWLRVFEVIFAAASQDIDPFTNPFIAPPAAAGLDQASVFKTFNRPMSSVAMNVGFIREQAFLAQDMDVYRDDVAQGEKWDVRLPGSKGNSKGLLLRRPKSLLFKYWTRSECPSPIGGPFSFLAVSLREGQWLFSTDPAQKLSLKPLADLLQTEERKEAPLRANQDIWYDGKQVQHSMVASPRGGTRLTEQSVLRIVKNWSKARLADQGRKLLRVGMLAGLAATAAVILFVVFGSSLFTSPPTDAPDTPKPGELAEIHDLYVLSIGVSKYKSLGMLPSAAQDAQDIATAFKKMEGRVWKKVETMVLQDEQAERGAIIDFGFDSWLLEQQTPTKHSLVVITFSGHGFIHNVTNRYHFAPQDYDRSNPGSTGIYIADLLRYVEKLPCTVVLIFDTCHSGAVGEDDTDRDTPDNLLKTIQRSVGESSHKKGLVVMAACAGSQRANETQRWGHGAFTLALLEVMEGKYLYKAEGRHETPLPKPGPSKFITLADLDRYAADRVEVLASEISAPKYRRQAAKSYFTGNITLDQIAIAARDK